VGLRVAFILVILFALTGCSTAERPILDDVRAGTPWGAVGLFDLQGRVIAPRERSGIARTDLNILALSGGGADGAFGAGLLAGWTERGNRPTFDIVTGVSTGALMASFAFLGPQYDGALTELYTSIRNEDVYTSLGLAGLLGDSLYDTAPLKAKIASILTESVLAEIAAEHKKGRRLYVATTNLDAGTITVWNMGAIAASDHPDRLQLYREILRASSAVPGFFKPVLIQSTEAGQGAQMHVDGGVKASALLRSFMLSGPYKRKYVYIVMNGSMKLRTSQSTVPANVAGIAKKSITELLRGLSYKTIYQAYVTVRRAGASFNIAYVPDDAPEIDDPLKFDPVEMGKLYEIGQTLGRSGRAWHSEPPRLEELERIEPSRSSGAAMKTPGLESAVDTPERSALHMGAASGVGELR
jgi:predicted patatin/cPLA2 family phospholipase